MHEPEEPPRLVLMPPSTGAMWAGRLALLAWVILVVGIAVLVVIPAFIVGAIVVGAAAVWISLKVLASRLRGDGRRNVRVIRRE